METFRAYKNYGCLAAEKRTVYTAGLPHHTAVTSEEIEIQIPEGWDMGENEIGEVIITSPWGWNYMPNDLLEGNENPYFAGYRKDGNQFRIKLEWKYI